MDQIIYDYNRVDRTRPKFHGNNGVRSGFRLNSRRFSVSKLRARFMCLFRILNRWRWSYERALQMLRNGVRSRKGMKRNNNSSRKSLVKNLNRVVDDDGDGLCKLRSLRRSNSFYAEAIADCLEFIKRSSLDQNPCDRHNQRLDCLHEH